MLVRKYLGKGKVIDFEFRLAHYPFGRETLTSMSYCPETVDIPPLERADSDPARSDIQRLPIYEADL